MALEPSGTYDDPVRQGLTDADLPVLRVSPKAAHDYTECGGLPQGDGLNLVEQGSGKYQGQLRISKRGQPRVRRRLYVAVLRLILQEGVQDWYRQEKGTHLNSYDSM